MNRTMVATLVAAIFATSLVWADEAVVPTEDGDTPPALHYQTGDVELPNKIARLHLGSRYRYLDPAETDKLLQAWGNPPGYDSQGAVVPAAVDPFTAEGWAVVLDYESDGHVDDSDAAKIDYSDLLKDMQAGTEAGTAERAKQGYPAMHLVGWAEPPHYDATARRLYWAKELASEGEEGGSTLNYAVRVLGREGVLSMNAVAAMPQLAQVRNDMRELTQVAEFNAGHRYADFNESTDRMAEYGLGALVAGGVAAKLGLFGKIGALLLAGKKFVAVIVVALLAALKRLFGSKKQQEPG